MTQGDTHTLNTCTYNGWISVVEIQVCMCACVCTCVSAILKGKLLLSAV